MTQSNTTTRRVVLTGAPSTGKTSVVARLQDLGHPVLHEISRDIITQEGTKLGGDDPWRNLLAFSEVIWNLRCAQHAEAAKYSGDVFYDRSLLDTLSYLQAGSKPTPEWMDLTPYPYHYKVFIFRVVRKNIKCQFWILTQGVDVFLHLLRHLPLRFFPFYHKLFAMNRLSNG